MSATTPPYPPPLPADAGENDIKSLVYQLTTNLRQVSDELSTERQERERERREGISVLRLHVPLAVLLIAVSTLVGAGIGAGAFWRDTKEHLADKDIHADKVKTLSLDGIAYNKVVDGKISDKVSDLEAADRRIIRSIKAGVKCAADPKHRGDSACVFIDPTTLPIH